MYVVMFVALWGSVRGDRNKILNNTYDDATNIHLVTMFSKYQNICCYFLMKIFVGALLEYYFAEC